MQHCTNIGNDPASAAPRWPGDRFVSPPNPSEAARLAALVRQQLADRDGVIDLAVCCEAAETELCDVDLEVVGGGREALLIPKRDGGFRIAVDPTPRAGWGSMSAIAREELAQHRRRFRIAHELGHTFFYSRELGEPRRLPLTRSVREEEFCDTFARALLLPVPAQPLTAQAILERQQRFNVSLEVSARSAVATGGTSLVALWRWDLASPGRRPALHLQWASDSAAARALGVVPYRTDPRGFGDVFASVGSRLGTSFSSVILEDRRQAVAAVL